MDVLLKQSNVFFTHSPHALLVSTMLDLTVVGQRIIESSTFWLFVLRSLLAALALA